MHRAPSPLRVIASALAFGILAFFGLFSLFAGSSNCTGGEADLDIVSLYAGIGLAAAAVMAVAGSRPIWVWLLCLAWLPYLNAAWFMIKVAHGWRTVGRTACTTIYDLPYPADGAEGTAPTLTLAFVAGIGVLLAISRRR